MQRRHFHRLSLAALAAPTLAMAKLPKIPATWPVLEHRIGGRLGAAVLDTAGDEVLGWRLDERFPMCSTFKWLLAAAVLQRVDAGQDRLDERMVFAGERFDFYAPVTKQHTDAEGMSVGALCAAAVGVSDNGAANLLLARIGGPAAVTAMARTLGDDTTRLDRIEPALNESAPGDPRDTTTPRAMARCLRAALLGKALSPASREQLANSMIATTTGDHRIRAGLPHDWKVGDKTGTGPRGSTGDVAIAWPPGRAPVIVVGYLTGSKADIGRCEAALADVGREAARIVALR